MTIQRIAHPETRGEYATSVAVHGVAILLTVYVARKLSERPYVTYIAGLTPVMTSLAVRKLTDPNLRRELNRERERSGNDAQLVELQSKMISGLNKMDELRVNQMRVLDNKVRDLTAENRELKENGDDLDIQLVKARENTRHWEMQALEHLKRVRELEKELSQPIDLARLGQLVEARSGQGEVKGGELPRVLADPDLPSNEGH